MPEFAHPSLDDLADLHEGLLPETRSRDVSGHLAGCGACTAAMASLDEVEAMLAAAGSTAETIPDSVAASLEVALRRASDERGAGVASLAERRTSSERVRAPARERHRWTLVAGAAASVVVLGYAGVTLLAGSPGGSDTSASSEATTARAQQGQVPSGLAAEQRSGPPSDAVDGVGPGPPPVVVTRRTLAAYAQRLTSGPVSGPETFQQDRQCSGVTVTSGATAGTVRWDGSRAVVVVDPAARRATVYACGAAPTRLFSTSY